MGSQGQRGEVEQRQGQGQGGQDVLEGLVVVDWEAGAQRLVTLDDGVERAGEGAEGERAAQAQGERDVVGRGEGLQLVEHPQALLGEGERQQRRPLLPLQRR